MILCALLLLRIRFEDSDGLNKMAKILGLEAEKKIFVISIMKYVLCQTIEKQLVFFTVF